MGGKTVDTIKIDFKNIVAHRGLSGLERENTASAFVAAGNRKNVGIETDVHVTADGKYILIHNDDTQMVTGKFHIVEQTDYDTLRSLRVLDTDGTTDRADLMLPNVVEYIRICKRYDKLCVLELKNSFTEKQVCEIVSIFEAEHYLDHTIFISFDYDNLVYLRKAYPDQPAQYLRCEYDDGLIGKLQAIHVDLDIHFNALTAERVQRLHAAGIAVNVWTVDEKTVAERLATWGVDYITSNILESAE